MFARCILWLHLNPHCQNEPCQQDNTNKLFHLVVPGSCEAYLSTSGYSGCKDLGVDGAVLNGCNLRDAFWKMFVPVCLFRTSICQHSQCNSLRWLSLSTPFNTCAQEGGPHSSISSPHPENFMLVMDWWRWCPIRVDDRASKREFWIGYLKPLTHVAIDLICSALDFRDVSCGSHRITQVLWWAQFFSQI